MAIPLADVAQKIFIRLFKILPEKCKGVESRLLEHNNVCYAATDGTAMFVRL